MNNGYYQNPIFPGQGITSNIEKTTIPNQQSISTYDQSQKNPYDGSEEQSYVENIIRINKGKMAKFHVTVPGSIEWQDRVFNGIIEQAGRDHVIVSNPNTGEWYLILLIYLDFVTFDEPINYNIKFATPPR